MDMETVGFSEVLASFYQSVPGDIPRKAVIVVFAKNVCVCVGGGADCYRSLRVFCITLSDLNTVRVFPSSFYEYDWVPHFIGGAHILCAREECAEDPA